MAVHPFAITNTVALYHLYFPRLPLPTLRAVVIKRPGEKIYAMPGLIRDMWRTVQKPIPADILGDAAAPPDINKVVVDADGSIAVIVNDTSWARLTKTEPFVALVADADADAQAAEAAEAQRFKGTALPTAFNMAKGLAASMTQWVAAGAPLASKEVHDARYEICKSCPDNDPNGFGPGLMRCRQCGCGGAKLNLETSKCPLNKW